MRTALSMAIDREGVINAAFKGEASVPRAVANPGTWGYAPEVFSAAGTRCPSRPRTSKARRRWSRPPARPASRSCWPPSNELAPVMTMANAVKAAAEDIGLTVELRPVSAANYINLFIDPERPRGHRRVHHRSTTRTTPIPAALYATFGMPDGSQNFNGYSNDDVTAPVRTRPVRPPTRRRGRRSSTQAQALLQQDLPWIGIANPDTVLVTNAGLTGAPASFTYMFSPWPAGLGGTN